MKLSAGKDLFKILSPKFLLEFSNYDRGKKSEKTDEFDCFATEFLEQLSVFMSLV